MGLALLVLSVVRGRNGKLFIFDLVVTGMGSILLSPTVLAVTNIELAAYNQRILTGAREDALPAPLKIDGYDYISLSKNEEQNDSHLAHSALKENLTLDLEEGSELSQ